MTIERALYAYLTAHATVSPLLSTRIYPEMAKGERAKEFPYVTYTQATEQPQYHMQGYAGLARVGITLDIWAEDQPQREAVARVLKSAIHAWRPYSAEGVDIRRAVIQDVPDSFVAPTDGSEDGVYQRSLDLDVWYREL